MLHFYILWLFDIFQKIKPLPILMSVVHTTHLWALQRGGYFHHFTGRKQKHRFRASVTYCNLLCHQPLSCYWGTTFTQWLWIIRSTVGMSFGNLIENSSQWGMQKDTRHWSPWRALPSNFRVVIYFPVVLSQQYLISSTNKFLKTIRSLLPPPNIFHCADSMKYSKAIYLCRSDWVL